jgi:hypothetical protein
VWLINDRGSFLSFWRLGKFKIFCLVRAISWFTDGCLFTVSSHVGRNKGSLLDLFYQGINSILEGLA